MKKNILWCATYNKFINKLKKGHSIYENPTIYTTDNIGFLKFVIVDKTKRGKGYGKEMLNLALQYAFQITGAKAVQLNVFNENTLAKQCYEKVGFVERKIDKDVFSYKDELWSRCNMIISKQSL